jgi:hypothetical protein
MITSGRRNRAISHARAHGREYGALPEPEKNMKKTAVLIVLGTFLAGTVACSPEVGSEKWCAKMKEKEKGEWTQDETKEYARNCLFK